MPRNLHEMLCSWIWLLDSTVYLKTKNHQTRGPIEMEKSTHNILRVRPILKVHKIENFFYSDFGICIISLLVMSKYSEFTKKCFW